MPSPKASHLFKISFLWDLIIVSNESCKTAGLGPGKRGEAEGG